MTNSVNFFNAHKLQKQDIFSLFFIVCCVLLLLSPIYNYDLFWHLANGRAMLEQGRIIQEELFSYTSYGAHFENHAWLSQFILYCVYAFFGYIGLVCFKILTSLTTLFLISRTISAKLYARWVIWFVCFLVIASGITRYSVRPQLFSFLGIALTMWLLSRINKENHNKVLIFISLVSTIIVWNFLHGAIYGLLLICCYTLSGLIISVMPGTGFFTNKRLPKRTLYGLFLVSLTTIVITLFNPVGFNLWDLLKTVLLDKTILKFTAEFQPTPFSSPFYGYWLLFAFIILFLLADLLQRRIDLFESLTLLSFGVLSIIYLRATAPFLLVSIPYLARYSSGLLEALTSKSQSGKMYAIILPLVCGMTALSLMALLKSEDRFGGTFRFGTGLDDTSTSSYPIGATNFVNNSGLKGNLYNSNHFGGYLAFHLTPDRPIFHYNHPVLFKDIYKFVHNKAEQDKWDINYAIVGQAIETQYTFRPPEWIPVYWEKNAIVLVRDRAENKDVIDRYRIYLFTPMITSEQIAAIATDSAAATRLTFEMSTYLKYRKDERVAGLFAGLIVQNGVQFDKNVRVQLVKNTLIYNDTSTQLLESLNILNQ